MQQHPVPQPITSYEFRLVGDMTLKQFGKVSAGVILALIVYGINPPPAILKWFFITLFAGTGFLVAFVPFNGRSIDIWILAFLKRIYFPTQYIWKPGNQTVPTASVFNPFDIVTSLSKIPERMSGYFLKFKKTKTEKIAPAIEIKPAVKPAVETPPPITTPVVPQTVVNTTLPSIPKPVTPSEGTRVEAKFTPNVFIPATPSSPNIVVGFIRTKQGKLAENAILEIRNSFGTPVRALKTNKLGQFQIATPLSNGSYEIEVEKEGLQFDIIKITLDGTILSPIEIVSK